MAKPARRDGAARTARGSGWAGWLAPVLRAFRRTWSGETAPARAAGRDGLMLRESAPGSRFDFATAVGDPTMNSAVAICLGWLTDNISEPRLVVTRPTPGGPAVPVEDHPLPALVEAPNSHYDGPGLWAATVIDYCATGNAYWLKARGADAGRPWELWWLPAASVTPCGEGESAFISHYLYRVRGREVRLRPDEVVHFRDGIDPEDPRRGRSRLRPVLREIYTDNEMAGYMGALIRNFGLAGAVIRPATPDVELTEEQARVITDRWRRTVTGELRGAPMVFSLPVEVEQLALTPERLGLHEARWTQEARIAAALRLPALVVGLNVGDLTRTYANYAQARRAAYEDCLMPLGRRLARTLERRLLPDFPGSAGLRVGWDYRDVTALREEWGALVERATQATAAGWMTRDEARALAGLPPAMGGARDGEES